MKWISILSITVSGLFLVNSSDAGLFKLQGTEKHSGCTEECQLPSCCPTIARPCTTNIYRYQRKFRNVKPAGCDIAPPCLLGCSAETSGCGPMMCPSGPLTGSCACPPDVSMGCGDSQNACGESCSGHSRCCDKQKCCEIARLIYESMTACYATERRNAIHRLGDHYDCVCHPEIMNAFIYALNDSDERVRSKAADEIGDQVRVNRCILGPPTIRALQQALADPDRRVRRQAEEALQQSGYQIVDGCCLPRNSADARVWSTATVAPKIQTEDASPDPQDTSLEDSSLVDVTETLPELVAPSSESTAASDDVQKPSAFSFTGQSKITEPRTPASSPPPVPPVTGDSLDSDGFFPSRLPHGPVETKQGKLSRLFKWKN